MPVAMSAEQYYAAQPAPATQEAYYQQPEGVVYATEHTGQPEQAVQQEGVHHQYIQQDHGQVIGQEHAVQHQQHVQHDPAAHQDQAVHYQQVQYEQTQQGQVQQEQAHHGQVVQHEQVQHGQVQHEQVQYEQAQHGQVQHGQVQQQQIQYEPMQQGQVQHDQMQHVNHDPAVNQEHNVQHVVHQEHSDPNAPPPAHVTPNGVKQEYAGQQPQAVAHDEWPGAESLPPGSWLCPKCGASNLQSKKRCGSCQGWRGGKRETGFKRKNAANAVGVPAPMPAQIPAPVQEAPGPWMCPCGTQNGKNKARCNSCLKWRGGKKKKTVQPWIPPPAPVAPPPPPRPPAAPVAVDPWTCDACGTVNGPKKVRCTACPRWKGGKRPTKESKEAAAQPWPGAAPPGFPPGHVVPPGAVPVPYAPPPQVPGNQWSCTFCGHHNNVGKKKNCGFCHKARPPAPKYPAGPVQAGPPALSQPTDVTLPAWICEGCGHTNLGTKARCGSCQHWKGGKRENMKGRGYKQQMAQGQVHPPIINQPGMPWQCNKCAHQNLPEKLRCASCQSWKNGKKQNTRVPAPAYPTQQHQSPQWRCVKCGHDNLNAKLRCGSCQSWKNGKRQMQSRNSLDPTQAAPQAQKPVPQIPWVCMGCARNNLAVNTVCSNCQRPREMSEQQAQGKPRKRIPMEPWICHGCNRENKGKKVRCGGCQKWRGGGRPDVAARKAMKAMHPRGQWICDRCSRPNKGSKQRCGGCQRWRDGQRATIIRGSNIKKEAVPPQAPGHVVTQQAPAPVQAGPEQAAPAPPQHPTPNFNTPAPGNVSAPNVPVPAPAPVQPKNEAPPQSVEMAQAPVPNQSGVNYVQAPVGQPAQVGQPAPAAAKVETKTEGGLWTCEKCTCDNLDSEDRCKICEALKPQ